MTTLGFGDIREEVGGAGGPAPAIATQTERESVLGRSRRARLALDLLRQNAPFGVPRRALLGEIVRRGRVCMRTARDDVLELEARGLVDVVYRDGGVDRAGRPRRIQVLVLVPQEAAPCPA